MVENSCCFTGHRIYKLPRDVLKQRLWAAITWMVEKDVENFYAGGAIGFDTMAEVAVLQIKETFPWIKLHLALPCPEQAEKWSLEDAKNLECIKERADSVTYTSPHYTEDCMHIRNRYLVDHCKYCIYLLERPRSGTNSTVAYACEKGRVLIGLSDYGLNSEWRLLY